MHNLVTARNRSCPAVSQICSFIFFPETSIIRVPNSTPIVCGQSAVTENGKQHMIDTCSAAISRENDAAYIFVR